MAFNLYTIKAVASGAIVNEFSSVMRDLCTIDINNSAMTEDQKTTSINAILAAPLSGTAKYYKGVEAIVSKIFDSLSGSLAFCDSGIYSPTSDNLVNLTAPLTLSTAQYMRVGNTVNMAGRFTAIPTDTATLTSFEIFLPVTTDLQNGYELAGVAFCGNIASQGAEITGNYSANTARFQWVSTDITEQSWSYNFSYRVI